MFVSSLHSRKTIEELTGEGIAGGIVLELDSSAGVFVGVGDGGGTVGEHVVHSHQLKVGRARVEHFLARRLASKKDIIAVAYYCFRYWGDKVKDKDGGHGEYFVDSSFEEETTLSCFSSA